MRICINLTGEALKVWQEIPKQKRSRYIEQALLKKNTYDDHFADVRKMLDEIVKKSVAETNDINLDDDVIDEILNM